MNRHRSLYHFGRTAAISGYLEIQSSETSKAAKVQKMQARAKAGRQNI
jgi:hypothetical protein